MSFFLDRLLEQAADNNSGRLETKFVVAKHEMSRLRAWVLSSPLNFRVPYPHRKITSLYLDTWDFRSYSDNLEGVDRRVKFRVRYYGDEWPKQAHLEAKLRCSRTGYKVRCPIDDEAIIRRIVSEPASNARGQDGWIRALSHLPTIDKSMAINLPVLLPAVEIAYHRKYYESVDYPVRLTIDRNVKYRRSGFTGGHFTDDPFIICEIKTPANPDIHTTRLISAIPFRASRNSKYCRAVSSVCEPLVPVGNWERYA